MRGLVVSKAKPKTAVRERDLLTAEQVAEHFQVSRKTVYDWVHHHRIAVFKNGPFLRFRKSDIDEFISDGVVPKRSKKGA